MERLYQMKMPSAVYSGAGAISAVSEIIGNRYKKVVLFTDPSIQKAGLLDRVLREIDKCDAQVYVINGLATEPTIYDVDKTVKQFRQEKYDFIVAVGGGSVMDVAKLASVLNTDDYTVFDMLNDSSVARKQLPTLMIPTTAGTGSEATPNSIVCIPERQLKVGIVNGVLIADYIILDVEMIRNLPRSIGASTGVDALAHAIECYTSKRATPFSDTMAMEAMRLIFPNIIPAVNGGDMEAKAQMLLASFYAGAAIAAAGTTAVHALAYPLGGKYHIAHGVSNAMLLVPVMRFNEPFCRDRLAQVYDVVMPQAPVGQGEKSAWVVNRLSEIIEALNIPSNLKDFGVSKDDMEYLIQGGLDCRRLLDNNCRPVTYEDAKALYVSIMSEE